MSLEKFRAVFYSSEWTSTSKIIAFVVIVILLTRDLFEINSFDFWNLNQLYFSKNEVLQILVFKTLASLYFTLFINEVIFETIKVNVRGLLESFFDSFVYFILRIGVCLFIVFTIADATKVIPMVHANKALVYCELATNKNECNYIFTAKPLNISLVEPKLKARLKQRYNLKD